MHKNYYTEINSCTQYFLVAMDNVKVTRECTAVLCSATDDAVLHGWDIHIPRQHYGITLYSSYIGCSFVGFGSFVLVTFAYPVPHVSLPFAGGIFVAGRHFSDAVFLVDVSEATAAITSPKQLRRVVMQIILF